MKKILFAALAFVAFGFTGCVEDNPFMGITDVSQDPTAVTAEDAVTVTAKTNGVSSAKLIYTVDGGTAQTVTMTGNSGTFTGVIPAQENEAVVSYFVEGTGSGSTVRSANKEYTVGALPGEYADVVMNEIDGVNKTIELYNKGTGVVALKDFKIIKNEGGGSSGPGDDVWWTGTDAAGSIAPSEYILIGNNADYKDTPFYGDAGISNGQNLKFELFDPSGASISVFTRGTPPWVQSSLSSVNPNSFQRIPNGTGDWLMALPTNGAENASEGTAIPQE